MNTKAQTTVKKYDGCIKCHQHVWEQSDKSKVCPICGGNRFDKQGHPLEQVIHFPLKPRLEALLRDSPAFKEACDYEKHRPKCQDDDVMAGVFLCVIFAY